MMQRRDFLATLAGGLLASEAAAQSKTNFVFILADDLGARDLGCYGNRYYATPNLDRLATQGARLTNAYAACPVCSPMRASIFGMRSGAPVCTNQRIGPETPFVMANLPPDRASGVSVTALS